MKTTKKPGTIAVLILLSVFIISAFSALALGVGTYRNITQVCEQGLEERLLFSYIWTKIKMGDEAAKVHIGDFNGLSALFIDEADAQVRGRTAIYHYDGSVYELFFEPGYEMRPGDGVPILKSDSLRFEQLEDGLIKVSTGTDSSLIYLNTGE
ncbi:MAG: DUF4860 domain-containing protein [Oscillospiraceae bacterium]|nr:DUF4860 domain-containing protein [Oscillospiraceae bacterium]